ncbi:MAG: hypothetical protein OHK93_005766 [Ramalina farinacea]|uniref:Uncharacterized protein n=1 Tax=Ramalina farinacea TaxID=258253 RepID=A0AA43QHB0_9LECA|nr:hypothetical protein [Ramalina farinacea]
MASTDIQKPFAGPFSKIGNLVDEQIRQIREKKLSITGIILVGGLGTSPYLYEHLKGKYGGQGINILQSTGTRPRTAICRGAIYKGFHQAMTHPEQSNNRILDMAPAVSVISTVARTSLGIRFDTPFIEGKHLKKDKRWDEDEGIYLATRQMEWYIRKGDNISILKPTQKTWHRHFPSEEHFDNHSYEPIYQCEDDDPPTRLAQSVSRLCDIEFTTNGAYSSLEDWTGKTGRSMKTLNYRVEMIPSGASNEFKVIHKGKTLGSQNVKTEFQ